MFLAFMKAAFSWLPLPLSLLVGYIFTVFVLVVLFQAIKVIMEIVGFLMNIFGGVLAKVVGLFV